MSALYDHIMSFAAVTERAALACLPFVGRGDSMQADAAAVSAMREAFNSLPIDFEIVIGEGERDQAPRLYTGEKLGDKTSDLKMDAAVDPLEGTSICAEGRGGALSMMAVSFRGGLFKAPDIYMDKIACGPAAKKFIKLSAPPKENILAAAQALKKPPEEITVGVLKRDRHKELAAKIREAGARIQLVGDGDAALALGAAFSSSPIDLLMGSGGAPEGVISSAALKCLGGGFQGRLLYKNEEERERAKRAGLKDLDKVWDISELASGEAFFFASGITAGPLAEGIKKEGSSLAVSTLILTPRGRRDLKSFYPI